MKKIYTAQSSILYVCALIFLLGVLNACSKDNEKPVFDINGEWLVQKTFKCTDEKTEKKINDYLLESANKGDEYKLTLKDGVYTEMATINYGSEVGIEVFRGEYKIDNMAMTMDVVLDDPAWSFTYHVFDFNFPKFFAAKQVMNKEDIERFYIDYLRLTAGGIDVPEDAIGELTIKAAKITN